MKYDRARRGVEESFLYLIFLEKEMKKPLGQFLFCSVFRS